MVTRINSGRTGVRELLGRDNTFTEDQLDEFLSNLREICGDDTVDHLLNDPGENDISDEDWMTALDKTCY